MRPLKTALLALTCLLLAVPVAQAAEKSMVKKPLRRPSIAAPLVGPAAPDKTMANNAANNAADNKEWQEKAAQTKEGDTLPSAPDLDESALLPPYPKGALTTMGKMRSWITGEEDTLLDVARHFGLGYVEMRAANPEIDAWAPPPDSEMIIPTFRILPRAKQEGIVVNLAEMRLYYFETPGAAPITYPIGIGRDGLMTPLGETTVTRKVAYPSWYPTARMRKEHSYLPAVVPPGAMNPLGTHALYLGWPEFRIHGSNKPWAIGRRVSSGCVRMYPEDIIKLFDAVPAGTKVTVVEQPLLVAWQGKKLWFEANPSRTQSNTLEIDGVFDEKPLTEGMKKAIIAAAGSRAKDAIDWKAVEKAARERSGIPVLIADIGTDTAKKAAPKKSPASAAAKTPATTKATQPHYNR